VTSEQDSLQICKEIIDECRPRFVCVLGGRYGWIPPGKTRSITADEVHYGVIDRALKDRGFAYFYFRNDAATAAMAEASAGEFREPQGSDNQKKLAELKQAINAASLNPFTYQAQWDNESRRLTALKKFGARVYDDLLGSMRSDPQLQDRFVTDTAAQPDEFDEENAAMEAFVEERSERFVLGSRQAVLEELLAHAGATGGNNYVCLTGAPGSGKSALLAYFCQHSTFNDQPSILLIRHFVGASPGSTDVRRTLRRLCHELKAGCPDITAEIPDDPEKLRSAFPDFLRLACGRRRVVIVLDAVNQFDLSPHSAGLHWLPEELPDNARIILSALEGPALDELRGRLRKPREIELRPLAAADGEAIIERFRRRYRKGFEPDQRASLLAKTDAGMPLYLLAALEELRTLGTYEEITRRIAELPPTTHALFAWILERLENDDGFRDALGRRVGGGLVPRFAALLGASRYGLSQRELTDLLDPEDPQGNVAALLHLLRPYLMRRGELLDFLHGQFRTAAEAAYLKPDKQRQATHKKLAAYFNRIGDPGRDGTWRGDSERALSELAYHLASAEDWACLEATLDALPYLHARCAVGHAYDLDIDFEHALAPANVHDQLRERLTEMRLFMARHLHVLAKSPEAIYQAAWNVANEGLLADAAASSLAAGCFPDFWFAELDRPGRKEFDPLIRTLPLGFVPGCGFVDATGGIIYASGLYHYDVSAFNYLSGLELRRLHEHANAVSCLAVSPDRRWLVAAAGDTTWPEGEKGQAPPYGKYNIISVWRLPSMRYHRKLIGHTEAVTALAFAPSGPTLLSGSDDATIRSWNLEDGSVELVGRHQNGSIVALSSAWWPEVVSFSVDGAVLRWASAGCLVLRPSGTPITAAVVAGPLLVAGTRDGEVWRFDPDGRIEKIAKLDGAIMGLATARNEEIFALDEQGTLAVIGGGAFWTTALRTQTRGLAVSPDGVRYAVGDAAGRLHVGRFRGAAPTAWNAHSGGVIFLAEASNRFISAGYDNTIKVWDWAKAEKAAASSDRLRDPLARTYASLPTLLRRSDNVVLSFATLQRYATVLVVSADSPDVPLVLRAAGGDIQDLCISWDGRRIAAADRDAKAVVWETASGQCLGVYSDRTEPFSSIAFFAGAEAVLLGGWGTEAHVASSNGQLIHVLGGHTKAITAVETDGHLAITGDDAGAIRIWDSVTGALVLERHAHAGAITAIRVVPEKGSILSTGSDGFLRCWSRQSLMKQFEWPAATPVDVNVSRNGLVLVRQGGKWIPISGSRVYRIGSDRVHDPDSFVLFDWNGDVLDKFEFERDCAVSHVEPLPSGDGFLILGWNYRAHKPVFQQVGQVESVLPILVPEVLRWGPPAGVLWDGHGRVVSTVSTTRAFLFDATSGRPIGTRDLLGADVFYPRVTGREVTAFDYGVSLSWNVETPGAGRSMEEQLVMPRWLSPSEAADRDRYSPITDKNVRAVIKAFHLQRNQWPTLVIEDFSRARVFVIVGFPACDVYVWNVAERPPTLHGVLRLRKGNFHTQDAVWSNSTGKLVLTGRSINGDNGELVEFVTDSEIRAAAGHDPGPEPRFGFTGGEGLKRISISGDGLIFLAAPESRSVNTVCVGDVRTGKLTTVWCGENREVIQVDWPKVFCLDKFEDRLRVLEIRDGKSR
jgi:telomerase protein component 1